MFEIFRLNAQERAVIHRTTVEDGPDPIRQRAAVIQLLDSGIPLGVVLHATQLPPVTVLVWFATFRSGGLDALANLPEKDYDKALLRWVQGLMRNLGLLA